MPGMTRRDFSKTMAAGLGAVATTSAVSSLFAQSGRRLKVGHTGITWGFQPDDAPNAIKDIGSLGFWGYESFGNVLEAWESKGGLGAVLQANKLPLRSAYCPVNLTDAAKRKDEVTKLTGWAKLIKKY